MRLHSKGRLLALPLNESDRQWQTHSHFLSSPMQGSARQCKAVQGSARQCKAVQGSARQCKAVQGSAIRCNAMQLNEMKRTAINASLS